MKLLLSMRKRTVLAWAAVWWAAAFSGSVFAQASGFQIIVHPDVKIRELSPTDLKALFALRKRQFADGTPVTLVVLDDQDPRQRAFATHVLNVLPYTLRQNWDSQSFSGSARAPIVVAGPAEMVKKVAATKGAIGYLGSKDGVVLEGVKHVDIQ